MKIELDLIPLGDIDEDIIDALKQELKEKNFVVRVFSKMSIPKTSLNFYRKQYNAEVIVDVLRKMEGNVIGLTNVDLYAKSLNFVFSLVEYDGPAIISTYRMNPIFYKERSNFDLLINRLVKEILYCVGRIHGLSECPNPKCLMHKSRSASDLDYKEDNFCKDCEIANTIKGLNL